METALLTPTQLEKPKLQPWLHSDLGEEIPYYDEEFDLMQGDPHKEAISLILPVFEYIAKETKKKFLSDQPAWYIDPYTKKQKRAASDIALSKQFNASITTAKDLEFVLEVVTTSDKRKEKKDTDRMYHWNEYNEVSEFCLYFPDVGDSRVLWLFGYENGLYKKIKPDKKGMLCSKIISGLCFRELPPDNWTSGKKIELWFKGEEIFNLSKERNLRKESVQKYKETEKKLHNAEMERWELEQKQKEEQRKREKLEEEKKEIKKQLESSIKKAITRGKLSFEEIAEDFGVSIDYIKQIK